MCFSVYGRDHTNTHMYIYIYIYIYILIEVFFLLCAKSINGIFNGYYIWSLGIGGSCEKKLWRPWLSSTTKLTFWVK